MFLRNSHRIIALHCFDADETDIRFGAHGIDEVFVSSAELLLVSSCSKTNTLSFVGEFGEITSTGAFVPSPVVLDTFSATRVPKTTQHTTQQALDC